MQGFEFLEEPQPQQPQQYQVPRARPKTVSFQPQQVAYRQPTQQTGARSRYIAQRRAEIRRQNALIFGGACTLTVAIVGMFAWFQSSQPVAKPQFDENLSAELDKRKEYLQEIFNIDYKPNPVGSNSVGYQQKLLLNVATRERMLAQDRLVKSGDPCNKSAGTIQTCLLRRQTETALPLKLRVLAGEKFALVSLDKKIKLTKSGKIDPKSLEAPTYPELTLIYLTALESAIDSGNYEIAYNNSTDPIRVQETFAALLDARRDRLIGEKRTDAAQELKNLEDWLKVERAKFQKEQQLKNGE